MPNLKKADYERILQEEYAKGFAEGYVKGIDKGIQKREEQTVRLLHCFAAATVDFAKTLREVDLCYPRTGVTIPFDLAERIVSGLRSPGRCRRLATEFNKILYETNCLHGERLLEIENELKELLSRKQE